MSAHPKGSGSARGWAGAAAFPAAAWACAVLLLAARMIWSSPPASASGAPYAAETRQAALRIGEGVFAGDLPRATSVTVPGSDALADPPPPVAASVVNPCSPDVGPGAPEDSCGPGGALVRAARQLDDTPAVVVRLAGAAPGGFQLARGASLDLSIAFDVDPAQPVGSLTGLLEYDPAVLRPTQCIRNLSADGAEALLGYCNAQFDRAAGRIRFNLLSADGVIGALTPFTLTVEAASNAATGESSDLVFSLEAVTGPRGEPLTWLTEDSSIHLLAPIAAPRVLIGPPEPQSEGLYRISLGRIASVPVWVEGVTNLGAATLTFSFDPAVARAVRCVVRSDLVPEINGGFCTTPPGVGTVRANLVTQQGFSGTGHFYDIIFAQAPNLIGGESTPITVTVESFISAAEIPIPTLVRNGELVTIVCSLPAPVLAIAPLFPGIELTWPHVTPDPCVLPVQVISYEVWRDAAPYDRTATASIAQVAVPLDTPAGATIRFTEAPAVPGLAVYRVVAVAFDGPRSDYSNMKGAFSYPLLPGSSVVR